MKAEEKEVKELVTTGERFKASEVENKIAAASLHEDKLLKAFTHCSKASEAEFIAAEQYSSGTSEQELNTLEQQYKEIEAVENARWQKENAFVHRFIAKITEDITS